MDDVQKFTKLVEDLQSRVQVQMLPSEKKMAQCALDCYNIPTDYNAVHRCVEGCQNQMQQVAKRVSGEFESLQGSVQACQQSVIKRLEPKFENARSDPEAQKALTVEFENGARRCIKDAEPLLGEMEARVKNILR
ncbi:unnamed protein product [Polarella glacialis]|uniref:Protein FAM136A n=1 Tax=Polarella glacialis TaxID=89957 RepID=A0A813LM12_POLGL|nr:unnamed protein product [Polarella glacialis]